MRRDGRVAEGARLESVYTLTGIGGSNPSLSASAEGTNSLLTKFNAQPLDRGYYHGDLFAQGLHLRFGAYISVFSGSFQFASKIGCCGRLKHIQNPFKRMCIHSNIFGYLRLSCCFQRLKKFPGLLRKELG